MSRFQQMKRQQAQQAAAANKVGSTKSTKTTSDDDLSFTTSSTSTSSSNPSLSSSSSTALTPSQYPLPSTKDIARRRWNLDHPSSSSSSSSLTSSLLSSKDLTFPSGYLSGDFTDSSSSSSSSPSSSSSLSKTAELVYASAQNTALAPGKQLLMTAFMLWMSGNSLQIFSIMMLGMAFWQPLQRLMNVSGEFARYEGSQVDVTVPKLIFVACNLAGVGLALYKSNSMGLLPTSSADWLSTAVRPVQEFAGGGWSA